MSVRVSAKAKVPVSEMARFPVSARVPVSAMARIS